MILSIKPKIYVYVFLAIVAIVGLILWNGSRDFTDGAVDTNAKEAKEVDQVAVGDTDKLIKFDADTSDIKWSCANLAGLVQVGYFYKLDGKAILDDANNLKQLEIIFDMTEMMANASSLSEKLQGPGFFQTESYPTSTFVSTSISDSPREGDPEGTTHVVEANFQVRDITKSITIPISVQFEDKKFSLASTFKLNRKDYGVVHHNATEDKLIHEDVLLNVEIQVDTISGGPNGGEQEVVTLEGVDLGPKFTEEIPATLAQFEMIRIPGDESEGIADFYMAKCEMQWDAFDYWALCEDMSEKQAVLARNKLLRPSAPHDLAAIYRNWGRKGQPVVGVSQKSAQLYCKWLSEQTGKPYRLPTTAEWMHAFQLGHDKDVEDKGLIAWSEENTLDEETFQPRAMKVGTLQPNKLGIHDMLGNASEWVSDKLVVRGGNFITLADDLVGTHEEAEDQSIWNANYPQLPKSIWWYKDADYVGFRVVCEAK